MSLNSNIITPDRNVFFNHRTFLLQLQPSVCAISGNVSNGPGLYRGGDAQFYRGGSGELLQNEDGRCIHSQRASSNDSRCALMSGVNPTSPVDIAHHQGDPTVPADAVQNRTSSQGTSTQTRWASFSENTVRNKLLCKCQTNTVKLLGKPKI